MTRPFNIKGEGEDDLPSIQLLSNEAKGLRGKRSYFAAPLLYTVEILQGEESASRFLE
jgi:hypothetical protein